jgi:hypothetical protein
MQTLEVHGGIVQIVPFSTVEGDPDYIKWRLRRNAAWRAAEGSAAELREDLKKAPRHKREGRDPCAPFSFSPFGTFQGAPQGRASGVMSQVED